MRLTARLSLCVAALAVLAACQATPTPTPTAPVLPTPAAAPDGPRVMYHSTLGGSNWFLVRPDGTDVRQLPLAAAAGSQITGLNWVPDLKAFVGVMRDYQGAEDLYLFDLQGNVTQRLTNNNFGESHARYSPARNQFVFVCVEFDLDICVVSPDGTNPANLTLYPSRDSHPSWSPDGERILYVSNRSAVPGLWLVQPNGGEPVAVNATGSTPEGNPSWAPDGSSILFDSQRDFNWEIYRVDPDGQNPRNLTNHPAMDTAPVFSPDGQFVAFRSDRDGQSDIFVMPAEGGDAVNLTRTPDVAETTFAWSPDSSQLVFASQVEGANDIFIINRDGTGKLNLTNSPESESDPQWVY